MKIIYTIIDYLSNHYVLKCTKIYRNKPREFLTVNQRVSGSSPEGGAKIDKPIFLSAFFFAKPERVKPEDQ